ncbi:DUF7351 domain-containing protein [Halococcus sp. AFM35]|uniref:DUF7351 domain-containing protein n=1 Tax=Halococcus sp. AFM35 TaxID=3421653 RepID=UPI003EBC6B26
MPDSTKQADTEKRSPENAFALLGNENRIRIIQAFNEASEESLSFSTLRSYANVDDSGQFNYHLNQLVGSFVRHTEDSKYELTYAGRRVIGAIFSGTFNQRGASLSFELDSICSVCGSTLVAEYKHERVTISCPACNQVISTFGFPPGAFVNRSRDELVHAFHSRIRSYSVSAFGGLCPNCAGRMCGSIIDDSEYFYEGQEVGIEYRCERCTESSVSSIGIYLLSHPAVYAFHHNHGIDLGETPLWELPWLREENLIVLSRNPWRIETTLELDGDSLEIVVDEDLSVSPV